jgi:hypothetical protein
MRLPKDRDKNKTFRWHFLTFFLNKKKTFQINSSRVKTHAHILPETEITSSDDSHCLRRELRVLLFNHGKDKLTCGEIKK